MINSKTLKPIPKKEQAATHFTRVFVKLSLPAFFWMRRIKKETISVLFDLVKPAPVQWQADQRTKYYENRMNFLSVIG
jgi:hypothetical protein